MKRLATFAMLLGSVGSVALTLYAGHRNPSRVLIAIFAVWVLVPYVAAMVIARSRPSGERGRVLDGAVVLMAAGSLGVYGWRVFGPPRPHMAAVFLITPAVCLVLLLLTAAVDRWRSSRRTVPG